MQLIDLWSKFKTRLNEQWIACQAISDRKSVQYGLQFSYPIYITSVFIGVLVQNPYLLITAAILALFGVFVPMHPLDYVYNYVIAKLIGTSKIPGRGSELQVNSIVALIFTLSVTGLIVFGAIINYTVLAGIYLLGSIFFVGIFLTKN